MKYTITGSILRVDENIKLVDFNDFYEISENITEIILPESLEKIDDNAFFDNVNIESIYLPFSLVEIGSHSFFGLDSLKYIYIPKSVKTIKEEAFVNCENCTILVENDENYYLKDWYKNVKDVKFNISKDKLREEKIKILYSFNDYLSNEEKEIFCDFTIDLFKSFPKFNYEDELELAYIVAGDFVKYMESLIGVDEIELERALKFIEKLQNNENQCVKELSTIGFVENIQNTWSEENKKNIYLKLGSKTKKAWNDLNEFWEKINNNE